MIPFNKPYLTGKETQYICNAVSEEHLSGNGPFTCIKSTSLSGFTF